MNIVGLEDYTEYTSLQLGFKLIAYVVYFNLSVIVRRQIQKSSDNVSKYEDKVENNVEVAGRANQASSIMQSQFNLAFVIYKIKWAWKAIDLISWHMFTFLSLTVIGLGLHWKLSVSTLLFFIVLFIYYISVSNSLQPIIKDKKASMSNQIKMLEELWKNEDQTAKIKAIRAKR